MKASGSRASDSDVSYCPWTTYGQRSAECGVCATSLWMMWQETLPEKSENTLIGTYVWKTKVKRDSLVDLERNQQEWDLAGGGGEVMAAAQWCQSIPKRDFFRSLTNHEIQGDRFTSTEFTKSCAMNQNISLLTHNGSHSNTSKYLCRLVSNPIENSIWKV